MKRTMLFLFLLIGLTQIGWAQERKAIDYQYKRGDNDFCAYAAYASISPNIIDLHIVTSYDISKLKTIQLKWGKKDVKLPFKKLNYLITNDDSSLNKLSISINLKKLFDDELSCENNIVFILDNNETFELPFNSCLIKEQLLRD
jgi:hypothetical protein